MLKHMGYWTDLSIEFANQRNYLDELFKIYPTIPDGIRDIDKHQWHHIEKCSEPKETNRQIGPLFKRWLANGGLGIKPVRINDFQKNEENAVLDASDAEMKDWCSKHLHYSREKGLDFVGKSRIK
jgi:hypothetical protein